MKGYPKNITALTKRDFENLISMPAYAEQTRAALIELAAVDDAVVTKDINSAGIADIERKPELVGIKNPMPAWKRAGFVSKDELDALIASSSKTK